MKTRVYLRIGKLGSKTKVAATTKPNYGSFTAGGYRSEKPIPTLLIALDLDISDKEFDAARVLLESKITNTIPAVEVNEAKSL